jgi:hypothetical protein
MENWERANANMVPTILARLALTPHNQYFLTACFNDDAGIDYFYLIFNLLFDFREVFKIISDGCYQTSSGWR